MKDYKLKIKKGKITIEDIFKLPELEILKLQRRKKCKI